MLMKFAHFDTDIGFELLILLFEQVASAETVAVEGVERNAIQVDQETEGEQDQNDKNRQGKVLKEWDLKDREAAQVRDGSFKKSTCPEQTHKLCKQDRNKRP